jgi:hypothetical protein
MVESFKEIFTGLQRAHGVTKVGHSNGDGTKVQGKSFIKREPVTDKLWLKHLQGTDSLGIIPINDDNQCRWGCIDIDSYAGFDHKKLVNKTISLQLPLVVCRSKSGGAHVFLFAESYVSAKLMQDRLTQIKAVLGYSGSEVFPKQTQLKSEDDTGNFLNLPYFNGDDTTRYAFNSLGEAVNLKGFFELYDLKKVTPQQLEELQIKRPETPYSDGPPCIELMAQNKVGEGGRNNALFHYGVYAKNKWPDNWKSKVVVFNETARLKLDTVKHLRQQSLFQESCMVQLKNRPPTLKEKDWVQLTNQLLQGAEVTEPAEGLRTEDQLQNHLEEFCLNRMSSTDKTDLPKGGVWTNNGYHHFVFDRFYHQFLMRRRWDLGYSRTAQMLKETCR